MGTAEDIAKALAPVLANATNPNDIKPGNTTSENALVSLFSKFGGITTLVSALGAGLTAIYTLPHVDSDQAERLVEMLTLVARFFMFCVTVLVCVYMIGRVYLKGLKCKYPNGVQAVKTVLLVLTAISLFGLSGCSTTAGQKELSQAKLEIQRAKDSNTTIGNAFADDWRATRRREIDTAYEQGITAASVSPDGGKTMVIDSRQMLAIQKVRDAEYAKVDAVWQANKGKILMANVDLVHAAARMDAMLNYLTNQQSTSDLINTSTDDLLKLLQQYTTFAPPAAPVAPATPVTGK